MPHAPVRRGLLHAIAALVVAAAAIVGAARAEAQARVAVVGNDPTAVEALTDALRPHPEVEVVAVTASAVDDAAAAVALAVRHDLNAVVTVDVRPRAATVRAFEAFDGFLLGRYTVKAAPDKVVATAAERLWPRLGPAITIARRASPQPPAIAGPHPASTSEPAAVVTAPGPRHPRRALGLRVAVAGERFYRRLRYRDDPREVTWPHSLSVNAVRVVLGWRPLRGRALEVMATGELSVGARGEADATGMDYATRASEWAASIGHGGRIRRMTLLGVVGLGQQRFSIDDDPASERVPDVSYLWLRAGAEVRLDAGRRWRVDGGLGLRYLLETGDLLGSAWFPRGDGEGVDVMVAGRWRAGRALDVFARFDLRHYFFGMNPQRGDAKVVGGAVDTYLGLSLGAELGWL
jgi:hypothetical protein